MPGDSTTMNLYLASIVSSIKDSKPPMVPSSLQTTREELSRNGPLQHLALSDFSRKSEAKKQVRGRVIPVK